MYTKGYKPTIGLEVHAELKTKSKMFCGCKNDPSGSLPNTNICPVCLAHPGTLPTPNEEAIKKVLQFGVAIGATFADYSEFDRKNYFYPDIPKAYQISQYAYPFLTGGEIKGVALTRVHLEEDTAKSQHGSDDSLVDFNRAGVPLMELVTEPVIHDSKTAGDFARELQLILRTLSISDAQMENGEMRVEANISVSKNDTLGTKVEVKNLNSFRSVEMAIEYEIERQIQVLDRGEKIIQETRGWDEAKGKTFTQRKKETANDYRYFPDPDLPKISLKTKLEWERSRLNDNMPDLPSKKRDSYEIIGLDEKLVEVLINDSYLDQIFSEVVRDNTGENKLLVLAANYLTSDVLALIASNPNKEPKLTSFTLTKLIKMVSEGKINSRIAKDILAVVLFTDEDPEEMARKGNLLQSSDTGDLMILVCSVIEDNPSVVKEYREGKVNVVQFLVGQGMKKSRGTANPGILLELLRQELDK